MGKIDQFVDGEIGSSILTKVNEAIKTVEISGSTISGSGTTTNPIMVDAYTQSEVDTLISDNSPTAGNLITLNTNEINVDSNFIEELVYTETELISSVVDEFNFDIAGASSNGDIIIYAGNNNRGIYRSDNGGSTWTYIMDANSINEIKFSDNGQYVMASPIGNTLPTLISSDGGLNFSGTTETFTTNTFCDLSNNGQYMAIVRNNWYILVSNNYGATFTETTYYDTFIGVAVSNSGQYMTAIATNDQISISDDYGVTFTKVHTSQNYKGVAMSASGQIQYATIYTGNILKSSDYGATWSDTTENLSSGSRITCSNDGSIAATLNWNQSSSGLIYTIDEGDTWVTKYFSLSKYNQVLETESILNVGGWDINLVTNIVPKVVLKGSFVFDVDYSGSTSDRSIVDKGYVDSYSISGFTDGAPTNTEIENILGTAASRGAGFKATLKDNTGTLLTYFVVSDGTDWYYTTTTKAT